MTRRRRRDASASRVTDFVLRSAQIRAVPGEEKRDNLRARFAAGIAERRAETSRDQDQCAMLKRPCRRGRNRSGRTGGTGRKVERDGRGTRNGNDRTGDARARARARNPANYKERKKSEPSKVCTPRPWRRALINLRQSRTRFDTPYFKYVRRLCVKALCTCVQFF